MEYLVSSFLFIFGAVVGSFVNVVALRHNTGRSLGGRSGCFSCGETLRVPELIPIVSFFALGGVCRHCKSALSLQYPLVEFTLGVLFASAYVFLPLGEAILLIAVAPFLAAIIIYDLRHKIVPDAFVYPLIVLAFAALFVDKESFEIVLPTHGAWLSGLAVATPLALVWLLSRGRAMGLGDAKLMLALGTLLTLSEAVTALVLSFWIGAALSISLLVGERLARAMPMGALRGPVEGHTMKSEIPFAPYLIVGYLAVAFGGFDFFNDINVLLLSLLTT